MVSLSRERESPGLIIELGHLVHGLIPNERLEALKLSFCMNKIVVVKAGNSLTFFSFSLSFLYLVIFQHII